MTRKFPHWKDELATTEFRQAVTAEYVGCFLFLFCTIGCVVFTQHGGISTTRQMEVSIVFGGMITILVYGIGPISGGNLNPAVSLALALSQKISPLRLVAYTAAQCLGAICGTGIVRIMNPSLFDKVDGGANEINSAANPTEAYGVEFGCTFLLVFTVMTATDAVRSKSNPHIGAIAPIVIGLAVTLAHFVAIPVDNCSINPARSFGVSSISGNWNDHHVFWFGPYLGATAAALVYNYLLAHQPEAHPIPPGSSSDGPGGAPAAALEAKEATLKEAALEAVAVSSTAPAATGQSDLSAWK